jgi:ABC-2 type transport system ATP-binding protein
MIEVESLSRRYGSVTAVDRVSFRIRSNEVVGLLGHNGAGKTTVMRMLSGYLEPSAGTIRFNNTDVAADPHPIQQQLGYLPEHLPIYPDMLVADYLDYAATLRGITGSERMVAVREALASTDLMARALDRIDTLSRGFRQRVGVAQAILGRPRLLILDEPTNGLDPQQAEHMRQLIRRLARRATVILSTHIMQEVEATCDRVLILRTGQLVLDQPLETLRSSHSLRLRTSAGSNSLQDQLRRMPQVAGVLRILQDAHSEEYTLELHHSADPDRAAGNIAHCVQACGARLYRLQPLTRDLSTVFQEATSRDQ